MLYKSRYWGADTLRLGDAYIGTAQWRRMVKNVGEAEPAKWQLVHQSPSLSASQPLSLPVLQPPSPPASQPNIAQPLSHPVPQPPSPPASQFPSLPVSQPLSLPASQPPSPSASQSLSLPVPQPPSLSASHSPNLPVPQPPSLQDSQPPSPPVPQPPRRPSVSQSLSLPASHSLNAIVLKKIVSKIFPFPTKLSQSWWGSSLMSLNVCAAPDRRMVRKKFFNVLWRRLAAAASAGGASIFYALAWLTIHQWIQWIETFFGKKAYYFYYASLRHTAELKDLLCLL